MTSDSIQSSGALCTRERYRMAAHDAWRGGDRVALGVYGERLAAAHLAADGMILLARKWRCARGELDLVACLRHPDVLVFCEVKTRRSTRYGTPAAAVVPVKAARIRQLAWQWMTETATHRAEVRFDVVSVLLTETAVVELEHLRGAF